MKEKEISVKRVVWINTAAIIAAVFLAIILHAVVPGSGDLNEAEFDSAFVHLLGFAPVAVSYFVILFLHCVIVMRCFGNRASLPGMQIGFRFGIVFAALYMVGMQEVVVEASPFNEWGAGFVNFQLYMGISDALPALLLCLGVAYFTLSSKNTPGTRQVLTPAEKIKAVSLVTVTFFTARAIGYETGILASNVNTFPVPAYLWTAVFGLVLGVCYTVLYPVFAGGRNKSLLSFKLAVLTIGMNWMLFNSFIGLIFSETMSGMLLRSGLDTAVFFGTAIIIQRYVLIKNKRAV
ncbi:MAG: hypothetical protein EA344_10390 [Alkalicoccus sp.]|uniref:Uncharacterized protein n=1 Tax=Alkalicoccus sp. TaxID=2005376 RepID=A0A651DHS4_9BACI|nr:MAG: hypothetical protein EA344_10390 [Alkalicoccus sp.]